MTNELFTARLVAASATNDKGDMLTREGVVIVATMADWDKISIVSDFEPASALPQGTKTVPLWDV
jgi:hypothetical protein